MTPDRQAKLDAIYRRGAALRSSRRRKLIAGPLVLASVAVVLGLSLRAAVNDPSDLVTTGIPATHPASGGMGGSEQSIDPVPEATTTVAPPPTPTILDTADPPVTTAPSPQTTVTTAPATTRPVPTTRVCRNSRDPECGPFRYDPVPTNQPTVLQATPSATTVPVGTPVSIHVLATDPDSAIGAFHCNDGVAWSDPTRHDPYCLAGCMAMEPRYGPWDPPPPTPGRYEVTSTHTYAQPATYEVGVFVSTEDCDFGPYQDKAGTKLTITVTAAS